MGKKKKLFHVDMFGYDKYEVEVFADEQNEKIAELKRRLTEQEGKIKELENAVKEGEKERYGLEVRLDEASRQRDAIARVLVDAEVKADDIIKTAVENGENETRRLMQESDKVRDKIAGQVDRVRSVEEATAAFAKAVIAKLRASADLFEKELMGAVDEASADTEKFLAETESVLDVDYFEDIREEAAAAETEAAAEAEAEVKEAEAEAEEDVKEPEAEESEELGEGEIPADFSFQESDEALSFLKVLRA